MYYTDLEEDLIDTVAVVLDSMGYEEYTFDIPTYDEVIKHGKGFLFVDVYLSYRPVKEDADELAFDFERKLGRYVRGPVEVTVDDYRTNRSILLIEFEPVVSYD